MKLGGLYDIRPLWCRKLPEMVFFVCSFYSAIPDSKLDLNFQFHKNHQNVHELLQQQRLNVHSTLQSFFQTHLVNSMNSSAVSVRPWLSGRLTDWQINGETKLGWKTVWPRSKATAIYPTRTWRTYHPQNLVPFWLPRINLSQRYCISTISKVLEHFPLHLIASSTEQKRLHYISAVNADGQHHINMHERYQRKQKC